MTVDQLIQALTAKPRRIFACVNDQGTAIAETALNETEYANPAYRAEAERHALASGDCNAINWQDVTDNDYFNPTDFPWLFAD